MDNERGENGGVVMDDGGENNGDVGEVIQRSDGGPIDAALAKIEEVDNPFDVKGGDSNSDRGTADSEAGADGGEKEGEVSDKGTDAVPDERVAALEKSLKEVSDKLNAPKPTELPPITEEQWAKYEQEWGAPRSVIERVTSQNVKVINQMTAYIDSKFAKLEFGNALDSFSKEPGFNDASRYKKEVTEFLQDYDPKHWSNPTLLKKAVYYARGINANGNVQKARVDSERNKRIAGAARPASPSGGIRRPAMVPLRPDQKEAAALMGGEQEYNKFRRNGRVTLE